jgi:M6 family metalloprotease-like protein
MRNRFVGQFCLGLVLVFVCAGLVQAAYLRNVPVHVKQPDGTVLSCLASGDEFYNWLHDKDGYTIVRNPATGFLVYANKVDGKLVPTEFIAGQSDVMFLEQAGIQKNLLDDQKPRAQALALPKGEPVLNAPRTGTINNLVVYIRFSDQEDFTPAFVDSTDAFFNSAVAGANSMVNYYTEASYNQLAISTTFYPGTTPAVYSYQDSYARAYYMPYDASTNPTGYNGDTERRTREHTLLQNAVNAISAEVPAGLNIDADDDNYVDNVCFVVKGEPTAWNTLLWPHMWSLYSYTVYINSKRVYTYNFQMESTLDVGVLCHEMFHSLGAPDLYHYSQDGLHPAWAWDLMEYNLDPPEHMTAYMKWKYGTWIASIPEITTSGTYTLNPLTSATNNCYKIASPYSSTEYFVVEYRKMTGGGTFEGNLYNEGLLVYRINTNYTGNASGPPDELYIYRPDGTTALDGTPWLAPFSAQQQRTAINDGTNPSSFLTDGSPGGLSISNVGYYNGTISFDVSINSITVTAPNGGESWAALGTAAVAWMSTGTMSTVDIMLSTDGGTTWTTLAEDTANDGAETVAVPLVASASCFVQVKEGASGVPYDNSDAAFSIVIPTSPITVTSPNGGESWAAGTIHNVTWTQTGLTGTATIDLYKGWVYQKTLGTANVSAGTFSWALAGDETAGSDYRIRISQGTAWDISDADFSVFVSTGLPFNEDFTAPASGWAQQNIGTDIGALWAYTATNYAGGTANEVRCRWWDVDPGTTRLITPPLDTTGISSLRLRFKHFLDTWAAGCVLKIQTSPDRTNWTDESWSIDSTDVNVGPETVETVLEHNLGIASTYVAFVITGNLYQYDFWYIDDVEITRAQGSEDLLATWDGQGVYYRNSDTGAWVKLASPATMITCGDIDQDGIDDVIGLWPTQGGIWVKYSATGTWARLSSTAVHIASGDMNGDGRDDLLGTWDGQGVYYRDSATGIWVKMASPATLITTGDIDGDAIDDLIGIWPSQGGIWVKYSQTGAWARLSSTAVDFASGDMNGDDRDDLLATWVGQGVFYRDSISGAWVKMASEATQVTCGDLDADGMRDLIGIWPGQGGVWAKYSETGAWARLSSTAIDITAGIMRLDGGAGMGLGAEAALTMPIGGAAEGPDLEGAKTDLSDTAPNGPRFAPRVQKNLEPRESARGASVRRVPGPGEPGFKAARQQSDLTPEQEPLRKGTARKRAQ